MSSQRLLDNVTDAGGCDQQRHLVESSIIAPREYEMTYRARGLRGVCVLEGGGGSSVDERRGRRD